MSDKRQSSRHQFKFFLNVFDHDSGVELGSLGDATTEGLLVVGGVRTEAGNRRRIHVAVPLQDGNTEDLVLEAECRWSRHDSESGSWLTGFTIEDSPLKSRVILAFLIKGDIWCR